MSIKLKYLVKYFVLGFIALFIVSCSPETETTAPSEGGNDRYPVLFAGNNIVEAVYGNSGAAEDHYASGRLNPNFASAAGYSFARLQFNGTDLTNGAVFTGAGINSGSVTNLADVDGSGTAAYTYATGAAEDEVARIVIDRLTPTNTSVISLTAVFVNSTDASDEVSYDFELTVNVAPVDIAMVPGLSQTIISTLVPGGANRLDTAVRFSQDGIARINTLDYSGLVPDLSAALNGLEYPNGTTGGTPGAIMLGRDLSPFVTFRASRGSEAVPAEPSNLGSLQFRVLTPAARGDYRGAISFAFLGQGNLTGSIVMPAATLTVSVEIPLSGAIEYANTSVDFGQTQTIEVDDSNLTPGLGGTVIYSIAAGDRDGIEINSSTGQITVDASRLTPGPYDLTVQVTSTALDSETVEDSLTVTVNPVGISGTIAYVDQDLRTGYAGTVDVALTTPGNFNAGSGTVTFTATANPAISGLTAASDGTVTIPNGVGAGTYTVMVSVSSTDGGTVPDASFTITVATPISGALAYDDLSLAGDYSARTRAVNSSSTYARGSGTPTMEVTYTPRISGVDMTADADGVVTIPAGLTGSGASGTTYDVTVTPTADIAAGGSAVAGTFTITVATPTSGTLMYDDLSLASGYTATNHTVNSSSTYAKGSGTPTMAVTYTAGTGGTTGLTLTADADGLVTIPAGLTGTTSGITYDVTVTPTADSAAGGTATAGTFMITVMSPIPVTGNFSYTAPAASAVRVGTATMINANVSSLNNAIGFSIAATTAGVDIGGVSVNNSGVITVNAERVGSAEYTVTARGATAATRITTITLKSSIQVDLSSLPRPNTSGTGGSNPGEFQNSNGNVIARAPSGTTTVARPGLTGIIIDNNRSSEFSFNSGEFIRAWAYGATASSGGRVSKLFYNTTTGNYEIGNNTSNPFASADTSLGIAFNYDFLANSGDYDIIVNLRSNSTSGNAGYNIELTAGANAFTRAGVSNPSYTGSQISSTGFSNRTTTVTYNSSAANRNITPRIYFSAPAGTQLLIRSITVQAR